MDIALTNTVKCFHLAKGVVSRCRANDKRHIPTLAQVVEYCRSKDHTKCSFYVRFIQTDKDIRQCVSAPR